MRRRRWARDAAALSCLAIAVMLQLAVVGGRPQPPLLPLTRAARPRTHSGSELPSPTAATATVHHAVAAAAGASVRFDAVVGAAVRCKSGGRKAASGAAAAASGGACAADDDDKRRIPTGPNPLHNR